MAKPMRIPTHGTVTKAGYESFTILPGCLTGKKWGGKKRSTASLGLALRGYGVKNTGHHCVCVAARETIKAWSAECLNMAECLMRWRCNFVYAPQGSGLNMTTGPNQIASHWTTVPTAFFIPGMLGCPPSSSKYITYSLVCQHCALLALER